MMGFLSLLQEALRIVCILFAGFIAITIVGCCLGSLVYLAAIVMDCMFSIMVWFWEHVIPDDRGSSPRRREPEPPPPPPALDRQGGQR